MRSWERWKIPARGWHGQLHFGDASFDWESQLFSVSLPSGSFPPLVFCFKSVDSLDARVSGTLEILFRCWRWFILIICYFSLFLLLPSSVAVIKETKKKPSFFTQASSILPLECVSSGETRSLSNSEYKSSSAVAVWNFAIFRFESAESLPGKVVRTAEAINVSLESIERESNRLLRHPRNCEKWTLVMRSSWSWCRQANASDPLANSTPLKALRRHV